MAYDGSVIACITDELNKTILNGRIVKLAQPEKDSLLITVKNNISQYRLFISVNPSFPVMYLTEKNIPSPAQAPAFCMLLRKHLAGGRIISIEQPSMERIINIGIEHYNEMGDLCRKTLTAELMGKHSNIIFTENGKIIDSIKHVSFLMSSVREVLPGKEYFIPFENEKLDPLTAGKTEFCDRVFNGGLKITKAMYTSLTGFSPDLAQEVLYSAGLDSDRSAGSFDETEKDHIYEEFCRITDIIKNKDFRPNILYSKEEPAAYAPFIFNSFKDFRCEEYSSISALLFDYYAKKQQYTSIRQKTSDLRQTVTALLHKDYKKYDLQLKQIKDTESKDKFRLYGDLLTTYCYNAAAGEKFMEAEDYNTGEMIRIPLDPDISVIDNAKKYYDKYSKLKRTGEALKEIVVNTKNEIDHLESISASLDTVKDQADIAEIKKEMEESGYIKARHSSARSKRSDSRKNSGGQSFKSNPLHYLSSDGFDIYVGKNNYQNEYISFKLADGNDWWFHAKNIPGSHVIIKSGGMDIPDSTFNEAARLAAYYSKAGGPSASVSGIKVEIDYTLRKNLKKTPGGKPGFVIYHTNFSMSAPAKISDIKEL